MPNMMDYLTWRGDLSLAASPWNQVDGLILASFSYNDLGEQAGGAHGITLRELAPRLNLRERKLNANGRQWCALLYAMADTDRFGGMWIHHYEDRVDPAREMQFSALTAELSDGQTYIAFRGTDNTLVGWREDFAMSYESPVPAQEAALAYLEAAGRRSTGPLLVGGHSKGGNLAAYAAARVSPDIQKRIRAVYSFDGPGLDEETITSAGYERIRPVVWSVVPQSSVVGLLMHHHQEYTVVRSTAPGLMQHDAFTWQVEGPRFLELPGVDRSSRLMDETLHQWLRACTPEQRRAFMDAVFSVIESTGAPTLAAMGEEKLKSAAAILGATRAMDPDVRKMCLHLLGQFVSIGAANAWDMLTEKPRALMQDDQSKEANG